MTRFLDESEAGEIVRNYLSEVGILTPTEDIIKRVPELNKCVVRPGKVSDSIYQTNDEKALLSEDGTPVRIMVRTPRISTHDKGRGEIPFKDQVLATNHNFMRKMVEPAIGTSQFEIPGLAMNATVIAAENLDTIPFENVLRLYLARSSTETSLYHAYFVKGKKEFCEHPLPENLLVNQKLPYLMDTPSTKGKIDMSVAPQYLFDNDICTPNEYAEISSNSKMAYGIVFGYLYDKGIILADTKTENGRNRKGKIVSQDELFTFDSSRYWSLEDYLKAIDEGRDPVSYSKEFARGMSEGDKKYTLEQQILIAVRYIMGIQKLTGRKFEPDTRPRDKALVEDIQLIVDRLGIKAY